MQTPMVGTWTVKIHAIRPFTIHGDLYYELQASKEDDPQTIFALRAPQHACGRINSGDTVTVTFLLGQVTAVKQA